MQEKEGLKQPDWGMAMTARCGGHSVFSPKQRSVAERITAKVLFRVWNFHDGTCRPSRAN